MDVIKKKAQSGLGAPASSPDAFTPWQAMQTALCDQLGVALNVDVLPGDGVVDSGEVKAMIKEMPETLLTFSFGIEEQPNMCFAAIEPCLASLITNNKLAVDESASGKDTDAVSASLLDLFLMRPYADIILQALNEQILALASQDSGQPLEKTGHSLNLMDYKLENPIDDWVKLTIIVAPEEVVVKEPETKKKPVKAKKPKADKKTDKQAGRDAPNAFYVLMPKKLLDAVAMAHNSRQDVPDFDPTEPWAVHMSEAAGAAEVCVKAVLETCHLNVAECTRLSIGQIIKLPSVSVQAITVETETEGGTVELAYSTLGTYKSNRAIQLSEDILPAFVSDLDTITI